MKKSNLFIFLFLLAISLVEAQEIIVHDPVAAEQDGVFYLFNTGRGISVHSSTDLENWKREEPVFSEKPDWTDDVVEDFENHIWAPDIFHKNGTYYLYYSVSSFAKNTSAIGVATNETLNPGDDNFEWVDHGIVVQSVPNRDMWNAIDPNMIEDEEGTVWMSFGSFWNGLKLVKMDEDLKSIAKPEEWHTIARRERSFDIPSEDPGDAALEAPFIFKKDGYYYQFLSWDLCCRGEESTYKVVVGRSKEVTGPYLDKKGKPLNEGGGTLVIQGNENWYGAGHNSVYTFNGKDYMFFHAYDAQDGAKPKLKIKELSWDKGWPTIAPLE
ncbi:ABC transporter substrate-binding protein [Salegentibacter salinarum]|uniref:ABC transporter substrate-binding protein n=1 Tax=Salegentibacter salinarum TaxID=447422 RepID=A0A2N0TY64_9FLAO|nr:arabinan endo-1,5-alpha-L-arabinosidase [Salegentibacter salinarum]PKD19693.1 ABC transporter substrate-binding protein [Salegentibacter salinarum]SKB90035.1 arabinan endo-1,5-alpha-L-arabinosidase [Salegentibacter salinarum]